MIRRLKKHWRESNEYYIALVAFVLFMTFDRWMPIVYRIFYPGARSTFIGSADPGILQWVITGILVFSLSWAVVWTALKFTFPDFTRWGDDKMGAMFNTISVNDSDWKRARLFFTVFVALVFILCWTIVNILAP